MTITASSLDRRWFRRVGALLLVASTLWLALMIPEADDTVKLLRSAPTERSPFVWGEDSTWFDLERRFTAARASDCAHLHVPILRSMDTLRMLVQAVAMGDHAPEDALFKKLEHQVFSMAPLVAGCPETFGAYLVEAGRMRDHVKRQSVAWSMDEPVTRQTLYRLLYGVRAAVEEVMLQLPESSVPELLRGRDETSQAPSSQLLSVSIRSGDILVSRGGAPTSALIARGNDFPGNFSHVALVHIDSTTGQVRIIESHIEKGVAVATIEEYLNDKKLRVMIMRLRHDHPAVLADPLVAHRAAQHALFDAQSRQIPYDFEMRYDDPTKLFCSEVASAAYASVGVKLWKGVSTISTPGLKSWLGAFGVRYFETQEPSDLEYDSQLSVVAEWRDPETLYQDHLDNAVTEAMLEGAERGDELAYDIVMLPAARMMKAYSVFLNLVGHLGPVPEGMSATAALRNRWYSDRHAAAVSLVRTKADAFRSANGYRPPYWRLLDLARTSLSELGD